MCSQQKGNEKLRALNLGKSRSEREMCFQKEGNEKPRALKARGELNLEIFEVPCTEHLGEKSLSPLYRNPGILKSFNYEKRLGLFT